MNITKNDIKIVGLYWDSDPSNIKYHYTDPKGNAWNVDYIANGYVHIWCVNAWGRTLNATVNLYEFLHTFQELKMPAVVVKAPSYATPKVFKK